MNVPFGGRGCYKFNITFRGFNVMVCSTCLCDDLEWSGTLQTLVKNPFEKEQGKTHHTPPEFNIPVVTIPKR